MSDQQRRAMADWNQIENAGRDLEKLAKTLELGRQTLEKQLEPLKLAHEGGCIEYKQALGNESFRSLEQSRFRSLSADAIVGLARSFGTLVYVAGIQRMICEGSIVMRERPVDAAQLPPEAEIDIKDLISGIEERVKTEPGLRGKQPVKNILMQISRYSREVAALREVTARTPQDKRGPIVANFQRTTETIFASIRKNYQQLREDERSTVPVAPQNVLLRYDLKPLVALFRGQQKETGEIRSALLFALGEQYGTRELLLEQAERHKRYTDLLKKEHARYLELGGTEVVAHQIAMAFRGELEKRITREIEYY